MASKISERILERHLAQNEVLEKQWYDYEVQQLEQNPSLSLFNDATESKDLKEALIREAIRLTNSCIQNFLESNERSFKNNSQTLLQSLEQLKDLFEESVEASSLLQPLR